MSPHYIDRFWSKVSFGEKFDCWNWTAGKFNTGYGQFKVDGKSKKAHRVAYELRNGPIPDGMFVCHRCDNKACCNPNHLFLGTHQDNMDDMVSKGRMPDCSGVNNNACKLSEDQVIEIRKLYATGNYTLTKLAGIFNLSVTHTFQIVKRKNWRHI